MKKEVQPQRNEAQQYDAATDCGSCKFFYWTFDAHKGGPVFLCDKGYATMHDERDKATYGRHCSGYESKDPS